MPRLLRSLHNFPAELQGGSLAIGNFDAVHVGHAALMRRLVELAADIGGPALVFTFDPPPGVVLRPDQPRIKPLTSMTRRAQLLETLGIAALVAYPTDATFLKMTARQFFDEIIVRSIAARGLVEGQNFRFGCGREGDVKMLQALCQASSIQMETIDLLSADSETVSSTRVRELVTLGQIAEANRILVQPYRIEGEVVEGAQRGRTIGFPTANLDHIPVVLPALGVYAGRVMSLENHPPAAIHIGPNPTFGESQPKVEVHIPGWSGSLYGQRCDVELLERVREVRKFSDIAELKQQLVHDVAQCIQIAQNHASAQGDNSRE